MKLTPSSTHRPDAFDAEARISCRRAPTGPPARRSTMLLA
jgi:hypothetical protein